MLVIPISSQLYQILQEQAQTRRMIFVTGLPGVGKSLLIQQLALIARQADRQVHLLQYNVAREPFEREPYASKYPEVEGVTDPAIRKAVGLWARTAVHHWHTTHPHAANLLIGELPLIGNRFIELAESHDDAVEDVLASEQAEFVVPVPSWEVRAVIEERRARTIADPQHEREKLDAPPNVLQALWQQVNSLARDIRLTKANPKTAYNPYIYGGVYQALLQHRHHKLLLIDQVLRPQQSVYELDMPINRLKASPAEVAHFMGEVENRYTPDGLKTAVSNWHAIITANPKPIDPGPELRLPLPDELPGVAKKTCLTADQRTALHNLMALPLDATPAATIPLLDRALEALAAGLEPDPIKANVDKFDIYDSYFNVTRTQANSGLAFLVGLLQAYRNVLQDLQIPPYTLTVVELPMLRIALETTLRQFEI
ncbi:MAG: hypothetical protein H6658_03780 [Ardenticatenaceae bacterium]|nr:hypothetical protein [Ardenticatenaceae bacterium]